MSVKKWPKLKYLRNINLERIVQLTTKKCLGKENYIQVGVFMERGNPGLRL